MAQSTDHLDSADYPWLVTLDETVLLCMDHLQAVRGAESDLIAGLHLKMASRALRCALEVYGMRLNREKVPNEVQS